MTARDVRRLITFLATNKVRKRVFGGVDVEMLRDGKRVGYGGLRQIH